MLDLKSTLARIRARFPFLDIVRQWRIERRQCRAVRLGMLQQSFGDFGLTPYIEVVIWRRRFYAILAAFVLLLVGCLLRGTGGSL